MTSKTALVTLLFMLFLFGGCTYDGKKIGVEELRDRLALPGDTIVLYDIRSSTLYNKGHAYKAKRLPAKYIRNEIKTLRKQEGDLALICEDGRRARAAGNLLKKEGIDIIVVEGGYEAWVEAGFPLKRKSSRKR